MLIIGVEGTQLRPQEMEWLQHDTVAGVLLFRRNFASRQQVTELTEAIRAAAGRPVLVCVDQEGGRVQRFTEEFTRLPPLNVLDSVYQQNAETALELAEHHAWLMASEIRAAGLDFSFAPVVDLARGNRAIGNRAFSAEPHIVAALTEAYIRGMHKAGMVATLKHFPGHGSVLEDTHTEQANDLRDLDTLYATDLIPFMAGIKANADAVMLAHVCYPNIAPEPAGYSPFWIQTVLREQMGFSGIIFSDDIGMAAAHSVGGVSGRVTAHLNAGCDVVLVCHPELVPEALFTTRDLSLNTAVLFSLMGRGGMGWQGLLADSQYQSHQNTLTAYNV